MAFHNLGEFRASRRSWRSARHAADASGDRDLRVWVRAREAHNARTGNRPAQVAIKLTDEAIDLAHGAPSVGLAQAVANCAYLSAAQGDTTGARSALTTVADMFDRLPTGASGHHASWTWPEATLRHLQGYIYARLGEPASAEPAIARALTLYPPERRTARAQVELSRALYLVKDGDVSDGLSHALTALERLPAGHRDTMTKQYTGEVVEALPDSKARALPAAKELRALTAGPLH